MSPGPPRTADGRQPPGPERMPVFALLDNIRSVWNVGSIFRTADAVALGGLYLAGMTATPPRPDMEKTALGATRTVPWDYWQDPAAAVRHVQAAGTKVVAMEQTPGARDWRAFTYPFPVCLVVGHEVRGVSRSVLEVADAVVEVPMAGAKQSLNVAVAFGVLAFEVRRRWERRGPA